MARSILCMGLDVKEQRVNPRVSTEREHQAKNTEREQKASALLHLSALPCTMHYFSAPPRPLSSGATDVMQSMPHQRAPGSCVKTNCDENTPIFLSEEGGQQRENEKTKHCKEKEQGREWGSIESKLNRGKGILKERE